MRGVRYLQVFFLFSCLMLAFQQRVCLSVGLIAMTDANRTNQNFPEYELTSLEKSNMLGSQFWGSVSTQLLGGYIGSQYGTVSLLFISQLGISLTGMLLPSSLALGGWQLFCGIRVLQGLCQGVMWPGVYAHLAQWSPPGERNRMGTITQTGVDVGITLGFAVSGFLATSRFGWPSMFYVPAAMGIMWSVAWLIIASNSPKESTFISEDELIHITTAQGTATTASGHQLHAPVPWCAILRSKPYRVLLCVKVSHAYAYLTLMQQVPLYFNGMFKFSIKVNALLSALPFALMCLMSYLTLFVAGLLRKKVSLTVLRKSINTYASWVPALAFVALCYQDNDDAVGSISCLVVALAAYSGVAIGSSLNHIDLTPNFAGLLFGITTTVMNSMGVISPFIVALVVENEGDEEDWGVIFLSIAVFLFVGNLLYILFGEMVVQPWNEIGPKVQGADPKEVK